MTLTSIKNNVKLNFDHPKVEDPPCPLKGYISPQRDFRSKITFAYDRSLQNKTYMLIEKSQDFPNWLIGQLNQLTNISRSGKALEAK